MKNHTLLIELGTEELPPKSLLELSTSFQNQLLKALIDAELVDKTAQTKNLSAPRRLSFSVKNVLELQQDQKIDRKGPAVKSAFKEDGTPTPALLGFSKSCGVDIDELERRETEKGEWLFFNQTMPGKPVQDIVQEALEKTIKRLPIAKRMRWGNSEVEFVRPVHWLVCLYGDKILPISALGLAAGDTSHGHRFHCNGPIKIIDADQYEGLLKQKGFVHVDFENRKNSIKQQIVSLAKSVNGYIEDDEDLLNEVSALVEFPNPILGNIDQRFMSVPQESLISSMRDHQKYFHVIDEKGKLLPHFITVSNINSKDENRVREGNERVLRARLSDAEFFWETDKKSKLEEGTKALENVTYHIKLGNMSSKVSRLENIAARLAPLIGANSEKSIRAAKLAKADLTSNMVGEFSDLQGTMGKYYALNDGEDTVVAEAIEQHYWPKSADSALPESLEAQTVSLADKLDSLVGIYGIGEIPTGDKDPYALRRASLGIINILTVNNHNLSVSGLIEIASESYKEQGIDITIESQQDIVQFIQDRYKPFYQARKYSTSVINAVSASGMDNPVDFASRIAAIDVFEDLSEASDLAAANKRISNILKKADISNETDSDIVTELLEDGEELDLYNVLIELEPSVMQQFENHQYEEGLKNLASLRDPIDAFFDKVMVMANDKSIKNNRLKLLQKIQQLFMHVADISLL